MYKQMTRQAKTKYQVRSIVVVRGCWRYAQADSSRSRERQRGVFDIYGGGDRNLTQLESAAESQATGPMWFAILLGNGPERDLPGNGTDPKSSSLDATQTLVGRTARREVQRASIVTTDAHPACGGRHGDGLWN
jgi:hypothetical protein